MATTTLKSKNRQMIRYLVNISSITLSSSGFASISSYYPGTQAGYAFLGCLLYNFGNVSTKTAIGVTGNGNYVLGSANATITNLQLAYIYAPAVEERS